MFTASGLLPAQSTSWLLEEDQISSVYATFLVNACSAPDDEGKVSLEGR